MGFNFFQTEQKQKNIQNKLQENIDVSFPIAVVGGPGVGKYTLLRNECRDFGNV